MLKKLLLILISVVIMFSALYYIADFDFWGAIFVSVGASVLTYLIPFNKKKESSDYR